MLMSDPYTASKHSDWTGLKNLRRGQRLLNVALGSLCRSWSCSPPAVFGHTAPSQNFYAHLNDVYSGWNTAGSSFTEWSVVSTLLGPALVPSSSAALTGVACGC